MRTMLEHLAGGEALLWCRICDRVRIGGEGTHKDGCVGWWVEVTEEMAADFFDRIEEIAGESR